MSTDNENIVEIEEVVDIEIEDADRGGHWPPPIRKPKCIAQVSPEAEDVTVRPSSNCCDKIITKVQSDLIIKTREVNASIIKGKVKCGSDHYKDVEGAIVVATTGSGASTKHYVGITNDDGEYSICVPTPTGGINPSATYSVAAYFVSSCVDSGICTPGKCESGCK